MKTGGKQKWTRAADAKEVGVGNPAEETFCSPESVFSVPEKAPNVQQNIFPFFVRLDRKPTPEIIRPGAGAGQSIRRPP